MDTDEDTSLDEHMARLQEYGTYMCIYVCRVRKHTYIHACMHAYIHTYTFFCARVPCSCYTGEACAPSGTLEFEKLIIVHSFSCTCAEVSVTVHGCVEDLACKSGAMTR